MQPFKYWKEQLEERRDIFLGYCKKSEHTAAAIKKHLLSLGARVLNWQTDFIPGRTIIDQIGQAAARSIGGIFEAGYFIGLKGKRSVLIIREAGSKMPADLGVDIYASLPDQTSIAPIERALDGFLGAL